MSQRLQASLFKRFWLLGFHPLEIQRLEVLIELQLAELVISQATVDRNSFALSRPSTSFTVPLS